MEETTALGGFLSILTVEQIKTGAPIKVHGTTVFINLVENGMVVLNQDLDRVVKVPISWILRLKKAVEAHDLTGHLNDLPVNAEEDALQASFDAVDEAKRNLEDSIPDYFESYAQEVEMEHRALPRSSYGEWLEFVHACAQVDL